MSQMLPAGLPIDSQNTARVVSSISGAMSSARSLAREPRLDAVALQRVGEQRVRRAVELRRRDDAAAAIGERQEGVGERRLAGRDGERATPPSSSATRFSRMSMVGLVMRL